MIDFWNGIASVLFNYAWISEPLSWAYATVIFGICFILFCFVYFIDNVPKEKYNELSEEDKSNHCIKEFPEFLKYVGMGVFVGVCVWALFPLVWWVFIWGSPVTIILFMVYKCGDIPDCVKNRKNKNHAREIAMEFKIEEIAKATYQEMQKDATTSAISYDFVLNSIKKKYKAK